MNTPDIDIEQIWWCAEHLASEWDAGECFQGRDNRQRGKASNCRIGKRLLVSLADQGGELWMETKCIRHGRSEPHPEYASYLAPNCDGGSRVRVWPKDDA